jgi:hypothetical protein
MAPYGDASRSQVAARCGQHHRARPRADGASAGASTWPVPGAVPHAPLICAEPGDSTHELSAARARDLRTTTRSRVVGRPSTASSFDAGPGSKWLRGHAGAATLPSRHKGQIAAEFPEPETLTSPAGRTQPPGHRHDQRPKGRARAFGDTFRAAWSPDARSKNAYDLEPRYGIDRRPSPYHGPLAVPVTAA